MDYRELCVEAGLIGEDEVDFTPGPDDLFRKLEDLGMFRISCSLPVISSGLYEYEASFKWDEPGSMNPGWRMFYGTGKTREWALVRLYIDRQRNG